MMKRQKEKPLAQTSGRGLGQSTKTANYPHYTPEAAKNQVLNLGSLLDLALAEFEGQLEQANQFQKLADLHRRRAWAALENLRGYQRILYQQQGGQGQ